MCGVRPKSVQKERQAALPGLRCHRHRSPDHLRHRPDQGREVLRIEVFAQLPTLLGSGDDLVRLLEAAMTGVVELGGRGEPLGQCVVEPEILSL